MLEKLKLVRPFSYVIISGVLLILLGVYLKQGVGEPDLSCSVDLCANPYGTTSIYDWGIPIKMLGEGLLFSLVLYLFPIRNKLKLWHLLVFTILFTGLLIVLGLMSIYPLDFLY